MSIAVELYVEFNTSSLQHLFQNPHLPPPFTVTTADFTTHHHFVSLWEKYLLKDWLTLVGMIRIAAELCEDFNTKVLLNI